MKSLVVEDNVVIRLDYVTLLEELGHQCFEAGSVAEATYLCKTHSFDLVLLDYQVQDGVSLPVVDCINISGAPTVIILITGTGAFPNGESSALAPRIDYVMRKPVVRDDLKALVDFAVRKIA